MLVLCLLFSKTYYAQNYAAGIIGLDLFMLPTKSTALSSIFLVIVCKIHSGNSQKYANRNTMHYPKSGHLLSSKILCKQNFVGSLLCVYVQCAELVSYVSILSTHVFVFMHI